MGKPSETRIKKPDGWEYIDEEFLAPFRGELSLEEAVAYFDGQSPSWKEAISKNIPQRKIVDDICDSLLEAQRIKRRQINLILGAGGEGKSTVLRQVVSQLSLQNSYDTILWREDFNAKLDISFIKEIANKSKGSWLIVSDEVDRVYNDIFDAAQLLKDRNKNKIQFLLCCRDTDWKSEKADLLNWRDVVTVLEETKIRGLTLPDAEKIVEAWKVYGEAGLGKVAGQSTDEAAKSLVEKSTSESYNNPAEGSFLGAMLQVRFGEAIQDHVKKILVSLSGRKFTNHDLTLLDAFSYIIALHSDNVLILTKEVLAKSLNLEVSLLNRNVLVPLGEEASIVVSEYSKYILTRHRTIAEVARNILETTSFGIDFEEDIYPTLYSSALKTFFEGNLEDEISKWNQLPETFFKHERKRLGIKLGELAVKLEERNPFPVVKLSKLHRQNEDLKKAVNTFRNSFGKVVSDRAYYYEWSTAEGNYNNHLFSVYLDALSLADDIRNEGLTDERFYLSLGGLTTSFGKLYKESKNEIFRESCLAVINLGLQGNPDERTKKILFFYKEQLSQPTNFEGTAEELIDKIKKGILLAENEMDVSWSEKSFEHSNTLKFDKMLEKVRRIDKKDDKRY